MIEKTQKYFAFKELIGVMDYFELQELGIEADCITGAFFRWNHEKLHSICRAQPSLHIITMANRHLFNKHVPNRGSLFLGNGDSNPKLELFTRDFTIEEYHKILDDLVATPMSERDEFHEVEVRFFRAMAGGADYRNPSIIQNILQRNKSAKFQ